MNTDPWRTVLTDPAPEIVEQPLGPTRVARAWLVVLECEHFETVKVEYRPGSGGRGTQQRDVADALPAPARARCAECGAA